MSIGENIKKMRELRNYKQSYVAEQLGMSLSGYSKIERDETDISFKRLKQIAEVLDTDFSNILDFDGNKVFNISQNQHAEGTQNAYAFVHNLQNNENISSLESFIEHLKEENLYLRQLLEKLSEKADH